MYTLREISHFIFYLFFSLNFVGGAFVGTFTCWACVFVKVIIIHNLKLRFFKIY